MELWFVSNSMIVCFTNLYCYDECAICCEYVSILICSQNLSAPTNDMPNDLSPAIMEAAGRAAGILILEGQSSTYIPPLPPQAHLWTVNGFVEVVNDVTVLPDGTPMDVDSSRPTCDSPTNAEPDDAPMEWMPFKRWLQVYGLCGGWRMGRQQVRACWDETCFNADKVGNCRHNAEMELEVYLSNKWVGFPDFAV